MGYDITPIHILGRIDRFAEKRLEYRPNPLTTGIAIKSIVPVLEDVDLWQLHRRLEYLQVKILRQHSGDGQWQGRDGVRVFRKDGCTDEDRDSANDVFAWNSRIPILAP